MKITKPGLYDMPNASYHEQTDWLSSTYLKSLLPEYISQPDSQEALDFGSLLHVVVLEPDHVDTFAEDNGIAVLDPRTIGIKADGTPSEKPTATQAWRQAVADAEGAGRCIYTQDKWDAWLAKANEMAQAVRDHETAAELLFNREGQFEESAFAEVDGVPCRARFDKRIPGVIIDLKSTSAKPGVESLGRSVRDYGYDLSAAHYLAVAEAAGLDAFTFAFVFVEKTPPYRVSVADLDDDWLERGRALRSLAIARHYGKADAYEGATGFLTIPCPRWARIREDYAA